MSFKLTLILSSLMISGAVSVCIPPKINIPFTAGCICPNFWTICNAPSTKNDLCQCQCPSTITCLPGKKVNRACQCVCANQNIQCPPNYKFDTDKCGCVCKKIIKICFPGFVFSDLFCQCIPDLIGK